MKTRREMAVALMGIPLVAKAVDLELQPKPDDTLEPGSTAQAEAENKPGPQPEPKMVPPPYSVSAANIISYTIYAEARGESFDGKMAVASVIKTRALRSKTSMAAVCMQDRQFSCWNELTEVPDFFLTGEGIQPDDLKARGECFGIAWVLMVSKRKWDYLTHFYNPDKATPEWAYELKGTRIIGRHVFGYID